MRNAAMAFGALFIIAAVCWLEVLTGSDSMIYLVGALLSTVVGVGYGYVAHARRG